MIVVTGGAGFIGSNIIRALNNKGVKEIIVCDELSNGEKHLNLNSLDFLDYMDKEDLLRELSNLPKIDTIFHQGACSNTMEADGKYMMKENYQYSKRLLGYCIDNNTRFIYASSASVYGNGENGFREEAECEYPLNVYAFSKYQFDRFASKFIGKSRAQIVGLRYFNVYGPQENHKGAMASVIKHFFEQSKEGVIKPFEGSENFLRDFIFIEDVCDVNMFFYYKDKKNGVYNVGTGVARSFFDIATIVSQETGARIESIPFPQALKGKYQAYTKADITKLRDIGYNNEFTSLEEGVKKYVKILKETAGYYKK